MSSSPSDGENNLWGLAIGALLFLGCIFFLMSVNAPASKKIQPSSPASTEVQKRTPPAA